MDTATHLRKLYRYNAWATGETIQSMESPGATTESTLKLLAHIIFAQELWLARIEAKTTGTFSPFPVWTFDECKLRAAAISAAWVTFFAGVGEEHLDVNITYRNSEGKEFTSALRDILTHVVNHSTYHRGQIASFVRAAGAKPASTDFIAYARK